jgi:hypothetical protein
MCYVWQSLKGFHVSSGYEGRGVREEMLGTLRVHTAPGHMHGLHSITESSYGWNITHRNPGCNGL